MIDQSTISRIFETADIVEVISEFVQLKKSGSNYKGLSPFSNEKTPSFFVSPSKSIYKDFSSGKGGNVVGFLMEHEKLSYPEALKYLAKKYNIEIEEKERTQEDIQAESERESLMVVTSFAHKFFMNTLRNTAEGKAIGMKYLQERGVREAIIEKFQLGYSPEEKDAFTKEALKSGFKLEYLVKAGLTIDKSDFRFDRFHGRVIFPIHGLSGNVAGFGGRILRSDKEMAKYLNSPESEIYHKSRILYGLFLARKAIVSANKCYLVEGYTDVMAMHQAGIENVVSSSGTALTTEQIRLIKRFTPNITIIYDGDPAGIQASFRGIDLILEEGLNVRGLLLPGGEDPDSFARKHSSTEMNAFIAANETDFINFKTNILLGDTQNDPVKRATLIQDIVRSIAVIPNGIMRSEYIRKCSTLLDVNEKILYTEMNKLRRKILDNKFQASTQPARASFDIPVQPLVPSFVEQVYSEPEEREIIYFLLKFGNDTLRISGENNEELTVAEYIIREIQNDNLEFQNLIYKKIFEDTRDLIEKDHSVTDKYFTFHDNRDVRELAVEIFTSRYEISKVWRRKDTYIELPGENLGTEVPKSLLAYKNKIIMIAREKISKELEKNSREGKMEKVSEYQKQIINLDKVKIALSKELGERTILSFVMGFNKI